MMSNHWVILGEAVDGFKCNQCKTGEAKWVVQNSVGEKKVVCDVCLQTLGAVGLASHWLRCLETLVNRFKEAGLSTKRFVKLAARGKDPVMEKGFYENLLEPGDLIIHLLNGGNYGIAAGGGLVLVEADGEPLASALASRFKTFTVLSGGHKMPHFYFAVDDLPADLNDKIPLVYGMEQASDGRLVPHHIGVVIIKNGYLVGPGSIHPSGGLYTIGLDAPIARVSWKDLLEVLKPFILESFREATERIERTTATEKRLNISIEKLLEVYGVKGLKKSGEQLYGPHPIHGSTTGRNFWVHIGKGVWYCFRCQSGGGPVSLLAVLEGLIRCDEARNGLNEELYHKTLEKAVEKGLLAKETLEKLSWEPSFQPTPLKKLVEEAKPIEYICKPLLPKRSLVLLAGKAGVGKSFIGLHVAHAVASSTKIFDHFDVEGSKVLIIDEENNPSCYKQRVEVMGLNPLDNIDCINLSGFKLDDRKHLDFLDKLLASNNYGLVIMDCWTNLVARIDENKAVEVSNILSALRRMAYERDCTFVLIHHLRKNLPYVVNEIDELRGSSALVNEPDIVYLVQVDEATGQRMLKTVKARYGNELTFRLAYKTEDGKLAIKWLGEVEKTEAESNTVECAKVIKDYLALKDEARREELVKAAQGFPKRTIDRALNYLLTMGAVERVKRGVYKLKTSVLPNLPNYLYNTGKTGKTDNCEVCGKPGGKPHVTDKGVVYLHDECMDKYKGKL
jgi:hypothetical protein